MPVNAPAFVPSEVIVSGGNGMGSTNTSVDRYSTVEKNVGGAITYADSVTLGASFTINQAGVYTINRTAVGSAALVAGISLNSTQLTTSIDAITAADRLAECSGSNISYNCGRTLRLNVGDVVRPHSSGYTKVATREKFSICRVA